VAGARVPLADVGFVAEPDFDAGAAWLRIGRFLMNAGRMKVMERGGGYPWPEATVMPLQPTSCGDKPCVSALVGLF
jgi:hypothetical protein